MGSFRHPTFDPPTFDCLPVNVGCVCSGDGLLTPVLTLVVGEC